MNIKIVNQPKSLNKTSLVLTMVLVTAIGATLTFFSHAASPPPAQVAVVQIKPAANLGLNAASTTSAALTWSRSATPGVTYNILRNSQVVGTTDTYTANYLDTGLVPGTTYTYTVVAKNTQASSVPTAALAVTTGTTTTPITKCGTKITAPGNYVLTGDLNVVKKLVPTALTKCVSVTNTDHVSIDCAGHTINIGGATNANFYTLTNVSHFLLTNCTDVLSAKASGDFNDLSTSQISNATFENNTFGNSYKTYGNNGASNIVGSTAASASNNVVNHNKFIDAFIAGAYIDRSYIGHNSVTWDSPSGSGINVGLAHGVSNIIYGNIIVGNGVYSPTGDFSGIDDNISLGTEDGFVESGDIVANNLMSGSYDCGIETLGSISNVTMTGNSITNFGINAICSYYYTSWQNNTVSNNTGTQGNLAATTAPSLMTFFDYNPVPAGTKVYFTNNVFSGNTFKAKANNPGCGIIVNFTNTKICNDQDTISSNLNSSNTVLGNNTFSNNNFGHITTMLPLALAPSSMIVDGGGNTCNNKNPNGTPANPPNGIVCL